MFSLCFSTDFCICRCSCLLFLEKGFYFASAHWCFLFISALTFAFTVVFTNSFEKWFLFFQHILMFSLLQHWDFHLTRGFFLTFSWKEFLFFHQILKFSPCFSTDFCICRCSCLFFLEKGFYFASAHWCFCFISTLILAFTVFLLFFSEKEFLFSSTYWCFLFVLALVFAFIGVFAYFFLKMVSFCSTYWCFLHCSTDFHIYSLFCEKGFLFFQHILMFPLPCSTDFCIYSFFANFF